MSWRPTNTGGALLKLRKGCRNQPGPAAERDEGLVMNLYVYRPLLMMMDIGKKENKKTKE